MRRALVMEAPPGGGVTLGTDGASLVLNFPLEGAMANLTGLQIVLLIAFATLTFFGGLSIVANAKRGMKKARVGAHMADLLRGYPDLAHEVRPVLRSGDSTPVRRRGAAR